MTQRTGAGPDSALPAEASSSIALTVIIAVVVVSTLVLGVFGVINYTLEREYRWTRLRSDLTVNTDQMAAGLELPVWNIDRDQIDKVIESSFSDVNIAGVVVNAAGRQHIRVRNVQGRPMPAASPFPTDGLESQVRTLRFGGEAIGDVRVFVTTRYIEQELRSTLLSSIATILLFDLLLSVGLYIMLWRGVLRPLQAVEQYAQDVSGIDVNGSDGTGAPPPLGGDGIRFSGEIARLRDSITRMVSLLDNRYQRMQESAAAHRKAEEEIRVSHSRLRGLAERMTTIREDEKSRLAHEIHDEFGQVLSAMKMDLAFLSRRLQAAERETSSGPLLQRIDGMSATIDSTIVKIRQIAIDLRPDLLDNLGLVEAIRWYAEDFQNRSGIRCLTFMPDPPPDVPPAAATALFRVTQEALTNAARHSEADTIELRLERPANFLRLIIADNGRGIEPDAASKPTSMGLLGIHERVLKFGGKSAVSRRPSGGTEVSIIIPWPITEGANPA